MADIPVLFTTKEECCGCNACCSICPASAIEMIRDNEGFLYPQIDEDKCLRCRMCLTVCPYSNLKDR